VGPFPSKCQFLYTNKTSSLHVTKFPWLTSLFRVKLAQDDEGEWVAMKLMKRENKPGSSLDKIFFNE
jgi:hypothetical protein